MLGFMGSVGQALSGRLRWLAIAFALLVAACTGPPPQNVAISLPLPPKQAAMQPAIEREHERILAAYGGVYNNDRLNAEITKLVNRLVAASERPDLKYKVTILNSPAVNAFALPNGRLYVTRGLIALTNDKAELASVLAHEMGHVIARHAQIRAEAARQAALVSHVFSDVVDDPQMSALALAKSKLTMASFSRAQEYEADGIGVGIAARAGFDPYGAARFLDDMQRNVDLKLPGGEPDPRAVDFLSAHPSTPDRIKNVIANARQFSGPGNGERNRAAYLASVNGMVYGDDPSEGFVRGRRFLHPRLAFTFVAPPGFTLNNTAQAVLGLKDGGAAAMRLDIVSVPAEQTLADYLKSGWIEHVDPVSVADVTVNGFPAATATAQGDGWSFRLYAIRFGSDVYRFIYAAKNRTPEIDAAFHASVDSFRRLSLKEASEIHPLHLKVVTVSAHDTVETLARRMVIADRAVTHFRVLNGLGPHDTVKPGQQVKLVVD
jgi:predicted Zn-dependent protease